MWKGYLQFVAREWAPVDLELDLRLCAILFLLQCRKWLLNFKHYLLTLEPHDGCVHLWFTSSHVTSDIVQLPFNVQKPSAAAPWLILTMRSSNCSGGVWGWNGWSPWPDPRTSSRLPACPAAASLPRNLEKVEDMINLASTQTSRSD